jgi:SAM-dependent methyltransferase
MNADPIASAYRWMEYAAFGRALERCRFSLLDDASAAERILILGEGDGRFLASLLRRNPRAQVDVVEASGEMIGLARARVEAPDLQRVRFHQQDALQQLPVGTWDAVVTNFFLDCLTGEEAGAFIPLAAERLDPGGIWLIGDFHLPARGIRRWHAWVWLRVMYAFFAFATQLRARKIPDYPRLLRGAGLVRERQRFWRGGLLTAEVWRKTYRK